MKYLDDEILANFPLPTHDDVSGKYYVYKYNRWDANDGEGFGGTYELVFIGNVFVLSTQSQIDIYMNDIIESLKKNVKTLETADRELAEITSFDSDYADEAVYTSYKITLKLNGLSDLDYNIDVFNGYHYPTLSYDTDMIGLPAVNDSGATVMLLREGYDAATLESTLLPRIPHIEDDYFSFGAHILPTYSQIKYNSKVYFYLYGDDRQMKYIWYNSTYKYIPQYAMLRDLYSNASWTYTTTKRETRYNIEYTGTNTGYKTTIDYLVDTFGLTEDEADRIFSKEEGLLLTDLTLSEFNEWKDKLDSDNIIQYSVSSHEITVQEVHTIDRNTLKLKMATTKKVFVYAVLQEGLDEGVSETAYKAFLTGECGKSGYEAAILYSKVATGETIVIYETESADEEAKLARIYGLAVGFGEASRDSYYTSKSALVDIAKIDYCPDRYYLMWHDRFGGLQCQPFAGIETYSEKFTNTRILNQYNQKRNGIVEVEPDWKLQSKWIPETEYPLYESLFTSSRVVLVDTESKVCQNVLITDTSYTEKNRRNNSHQLLNFTINVQLNKNQRIRF